MCVAFRKRKTANNEVVMRTTAPDAVTTNSPENSRAATRMASDPRWKKKFAENPVPLNCTTPRCIIRIINTKKIDPTIMAIARGREGITFDNPKKNSVQTKPERPAAQTLPESAKSAEIAVGAAMMTEHASTAAISVFNTKSLHDHLV